MFTSRFLTTSGKAMSVLPPRHDATMVSIEQLTRLSQFVELRMGLHFPPNRLKDLERGICAAAGDLGFTDIERCIDWLLTTPVSHGSMETLASHLTIGETYFFRDLRMFEILEHDVLPAVLDSRRSGEQYLRIWSAGCATGEEAYSLAILLNKLLPDPGNWHITILATDIAPLCLRRAAEGLYNEWSFRDTPKWVTEGYFEKQGQRLAIAPRIKEMVTFAHLNLVEDVYPAILNKTSGMDLIVCRNVLIYFSPQRALTVLEKLSRCLVDNGWLVTGPAEAPTHRLSPFLQPVSFPGALFFRKGQAQEAGTSTFRSPLQIATPTAVCRRPDATVATAGKKPATAAPVVCETQSEGHDQSVACRARSLADRGRLADALSLCTEAIQHDKLNPAMHYLQAVILQEMACWDDAAATLKRAIYIDQDFAVAHFALGHLLHRQGKKKAAAKHLHQARILLQAIDPEDTPPEAEGIRAGRLIELIERMEELMP